MKQFFLPGARNEYSNAHESATICTVFAPGQDDHVWGNDASCERAKQRGKCVCVLASSALLNVGINYVVRGCDYLFL